MDFFIPDVPLEDLRNAGLRLQRGGVGFYPSSGSAFVHMDIGSVRHWPRMPEAQLARVMSNARQVQLAAATATDRPGTVQTAVARYQPSALAKMFTPARDAEDEDDKVAGRSGPGPRASACRRVPRRAALSSQPRARRADAGRQTEPRGDRSSSLRRPRRRQGRRRRRA